MNNNNNNDKFYTINDLMEETYYELPTKFFENPKYINMRLESKVAYSLLKDVIKISIANGWVNELGQLYIKIDKEVLRTMLNIKTKKKMNEVIEELINKDLIVKDRDKIYIKGVEDYEY